jgi:chromate transporter
MKSLAQIAATFATVSLVAIGGANAVVPEIHRRVVDVLGWMTSGQFATLFAISQAAPGPNVLIVSLIGWQVAGLAGLAVATLAMVVPSCALAYAIGRMMTHVAGRRWFRLLQDALVPLAIGLILATGIDMARATGHGALPVAITAGAALFVLGTRANPLWALAGAMAVSIAGARLGLPV